ncbi:putative er membrane protein [Botrytis fragariae]|uniref:Putative er membrane protein n=1 Tax=Botrytis fragariae TaxID=1964551 RepID=A0A8H6EDE5_9HELO|nr:putative er membrane protein [Botrytis fragariae]KAF5868154.1 putative er membrane protein [Botrytis fragariae]
MFYSRQDSYRLGVVAICLFAFLKHVQGVSMEYCSTLNTGSGSANSSIYQSDGLCYDFCLDEYAFAVVQGSECWCSNYVPGTTSSTSDCDTPCPGYPDDTCGGDSLYGYMSLTLSPSGTKGAATTSSTSTSSEKVTTSTSSPEPVTTSSSTAEATSSTVSPKTTSSTSATEASTTSTIPPTTVAAQKSSSSTSGSTSSTWTPTPVISLETITGQVRTVTVTPTAPPNSSSDSSVSEGNGGLTTGAAVGLTIGLVALIAIIAGVTYFCIRKRRQEKAERYAAVNSRRESLAGVVGVGGPIPSRTMSENSRFVLGTDGKRVVETWEPELHTPGSRRSQLMPVDPRLDPFAPVYQRGDNKSRESINTIRDDHDYSRRVHQQGPILRAVNPDPD